MATLLYRLGHFASRRRWAVLVVWLALLIGMGAAAVAFSGTMTSSFSIPGTQAQAALDQLGEKIPGAGDATGRIVFAAPEGKTLAEPAYQQAIGNVVAQAKELPGVTNVIDPATGRTVSPDQRVAFAQAFFAGQITEIPEATQAELATIADAYQVEGLQIELGGGAVRAGPGHRLHRGHRRHRRDGRAADHLRLDRRRRTADADRADRRRHRHGRAFSGPPASSRCPTPHRFSR